MEQFKLSSADLIFFNSILDQINKENPSFLVSKQISVLKSMMNDYEKNGTISFPKIRLEIDKIAETLKPVSLDLVKSVSDKAKAICKGCIFHDDNCLINILFITFKSVELKKKVEFKDLRPNVRIAF